MINFIKLFSAVILLCLVIIIIIGVFAPRSTFLTRTQVIKSPVNVVWRALIAVENYPAWQSGVKKVTINKGEQIWQGATLRYFLKGYEPEIFHEEQVIKIESDKKLIVERLGIYENPLLKYYKIAYTLKPLLDGTTELTVEVSYQPTSFVTRIYNQMYLKGNISNIWEVNLAALRDLIENS